MTYEYKQLRAENIKPAFFLHRFITTKSCFVVVVVVVVFAAAAFHFYK
jgi:hypothetical protein